MEWFNNFSISNQYTTPLLSITTISLLATKLSTLDLSDHAIYFSQIGHYAKRKQLFIFPGTTYDSVWQRMKTEMGRKIPSCVMEWFNNSSISNKYTTRRTYAWSLRTRSLTHQITVCVNDHMNDHMNDLHYSEWPWNDFSRLSNNVIFYTTNICMASTSSHSWTWCINTK